MSSEKIEAFWENATADDVARMMKGETVEARFRDHLQEDWGKRIWNLAGYDSTQENSWIDSTGCPWRYCQVYREPAWWLDKPDPGPGWRLLGKLPDEELKPGDDAWDVWNDKQWRESDSANGRLPQGRDIWYRRRIEPVEPEPKHYVLRVGDSVETPSGHRVEAVSRSETQWFYRLSAGDNLMLPNGQTITITAKGFEVTQ
jgi:hypothetical protein